MGLVKKAMGNWRMCVDYTDLNKACLKDAYPRPNIDKRVGNSSGYNLMSFMDAYSGYNQIPMDKNDRNHMAFMTEGANYIYNVMPFGQQNTGATYQRMLNKVFKKEIGDMLEVYMDEMIVKLDEQSQHRRHLEVVFNYVRQYNMRLNPEKCTFGVKAGKFLGFYLTEWGIEANPDKCRVVLEMEPPSSKERIMKLNGMLMVLSRFISKSAQHALPFFTLLRKEANLNGQNNMGGIRQVEDHPLTTPRPIQANGGGKLVPLLGNLGRSSQHRSSKGDRDQPEPGLILLESPGGVGDTLPKD